MSVQNIINRTYDALFRNLYLKPRFLFKLPKRKDLYSCKSYYPDQTARKPWQNYLYQVGEVLRYGAPDHFYFMYGKDVKSKGEQSTYINYAPFERRRDQLNGKDDAHNVTCILRDKLFFDIFAHSIGIATPTIVAFYSRGILYSATNGFKRMGFEELARCGESKLFCKETNGECGRGVFMLELRDDGYYIDNVLITPDELEKSIQGSEYLFQQVIEQHSEMSRLNASSINSIRLITVRSLKDGEIHVMPSILRIGTNGSVVDNTSQGGIAVGIDLETGKLHEKGFYKPEFGRTTKMHPNSGVVLSEFYIPYMKDAIEQAKFFHYMLGIHSVGWDIAIGPKGPIFIEGNDNWEINGPQVGNHGLRKEFEEYFFM